MKTFQDLEFKKHSVGNGLHARMDFDNGYGVSVVRFKMSGFPFEANDLGYGSYTSNENEWELAIFKGKALCYDSGITEDVMGHLTKEEVTDVMKRVQELNLVKP